MTDDQSVARALALDDAFEVVRTLGGGGASATELVNLADAGPFVRKRIPLGLANRAAWEAIRDANEPLLPRVRLTYTLPDQLVIVCDYVEGETLEQLVALQGPMDARRAAAIVQDVCQAAASLHQTGVVHRDITPKNVVVSADGRAHLIDLGIARVHVDGERHDTTHLGTVSFAAPEQFGFAQTDARSDVYAIGGVLGYLLTGLDPQAEGFEPALAGADARLAAVVEKARQFEPSSRYASARELAEAVQQAVGVTPATTQPVAPAPQSVATQLAAAPQPAPAPQPVAPGPKHPALHAWFGLQRPTASEVAAAWKSASLPVKLAMIPLIALTCALCYRMAITPQSLRGLSADALLAFNVVMRTEMSITVFLIPGVDLALTMLGFAPRIGFGRLVLRALARWAMWLALATALTVTAVIVFGIAAVR